MNWSAHLSQTTVDMCHLAQFKISETCCFTNLKKKKKTFNVRLSSKAFQMFGREFKIIVNNLSFVHNVNETQISDQIIQYQTLINFDK
jgi:hypothetical protein